MFECPIVSKDISRRADSEYCSRRACFLAAIKNCWIEEDRGIELILERISLPPSPFLDQLRWSMLSG